MGPQGFLLTGKWKPIYSEPLTYTAAIAPLTYRGQFTRRSPHPVHSSRVFKFNIGLGLGIVILRIGLGLGIVILRIWDLLPEPEVEVVLVFSLLLPLLHLDKLAMVAVDKPAVDVNLDIQILLCLF